MYKYHSVNIIGSMSSSQIIVLYDFATVNATILLAFHQLIYLSLCFII